VGDWLQEQAGLFLSGDSDAKPLKERIVEVLSKEWPLSAKKIHSIIKAQGTPFTYQGVHKASIQLIEHGVLLSDKGGYSVNPAWVHALKKFTHDLELSRLKNVPCNVMEMPPYSSISVNFEGMLVEPYYWSLDQEYKIWQARGSPLNTVLLMRRAWPIPLGEEEAKKFYQIFVDKEQYIICASKKKVDDVMLTTWRKLGWKCAYSDLASAGDTIVFSDYVVQVLRPKKADEQWNKIYSEIDDDPVLPLFRANEVAFEIKTKTTLAITRNKEFAEKIRQDARRIFEGKKQ